MARLQFPPVPEGVNPYLYIERYLHYLFNPLPTPGFDARLYVLWALMGYGIVMSIVYLCLMAVEYRRRDKRFWLWRLVSRSNGRYIVGNQHALFALFSLASCAVLVGYNNNFRRAALLQRFQARAYFWRSLVWIPLIVHAWISSWSNLQAAILSSQKATKTHILSPKLANGLYIAGFLVLIPVIVLDVYTAFAWTKTWDAGMVLRTTLTSLGQARPNDSAQAAETAIAAQFNKVADKLQFFIHMLQAVHALYVFTMLVIIGVNLGGLGLLFTLRRQIKFNSRRLSSQIRTSSHPAHASSTAGAGSSIGTPLASPALVPPSDSPHPLSPRMDGDQTPPKQTLLRHVFFAGQAKEKDDSSETTSRGRNHMSVGELKEAAENMTQAGAANRQQAKQLLALKKVEWDLIVFLAAIVVMATVFLALALWLAISPSSVYSSWRTMEVSFYLVPWMYLTGVDCSLTFLTLNSTRHLLSSSSRFASVIGIHGRQVDSRRVSVSGLTSDELESESFGRPVGAGGTMSRVEEEGEERGHVAVEMDARKRDETPSGTTTASV
ncbi:Proteophosphoglycan 5 [Rhodotorula toruloides ATCC 204091]|uniref:Proteophosphoglycan 5 n=1 Tax=Rhodotorula toruloides TaxID=5286 RepID=A0A0K3CN85_RHOTO|nr:Proteophosphoglycan 5 [Rhodotorula toruloides ATCC 204091]KAK4330399.1 Proteophosphoglycan 5 [Rhodotorula toruloides]PRQ71041.1 Proteophosphoglycan 5 [Rhodotorula toruloides]